MTPYALITGASQGLGKALAVEVSKRKINTLLVSRSYQKLEVLSNELMETYGVDSRPIACDLSIPEHVIDLARRIDSEFEVFMLINNAGVGGSKRFADAEPGYINTILQLNITCTALLTHQLLPNLRRQESAYILNVSSIAAFNPTGYKTVYPGSKSFIYSFSLGLYQELKGSSIHVAVVCPGAMKTNDEIARRIEKQGVFAKLILTDTEKTARICIRRLYKKDPLINVTPWIRLFSKLLPERFRLQLLTKTVHREIDEVANI